MRLSGVLKVTKLTLALAGVSLLSQAQQKQSLKLWYKQPAVKWTDALPIGNGRLGAMIYGGVQEEHLQFNEATFWNGGPRAYHREGAVKYLPIIRRLIAEGKQKEAEALAQKQFMGTRRGEETYSADSAKWVQSVLKGGVPEKVTAGKVIKLPVEQGWETTPDFEGLDGAVWLTKTFKLPAEWVGKNLVLSLGRVRDMDVTYVNGVKMGSTSGTAYRKYIIPGDRVTAGENKIAIQVLNFFDKGGLTSNAQELCIYPQDYEVADVKSAKSDMMAAVNPKTGEAVKVITLAGEWQYKVQDTNPPATPRYNADYQPFADLYLNFLSKGTAANYRRELDITNALSTVSYRQNGVTYKREYFTSAPDNVLGIMLSASKPGQLSLQASLSTLHKEFTIRKVDNNTLALVQKVNNGVLKGATYLKVVNTGGQATVSNKGIAISNANQVVFYLVAATSFKNYQDVSGDPETTCKARLAAVGNKTYAAIKAMHVADYQKLFNRFSIYLGKSPSDNLPTDERILSFAKKVPDPSFVSLYVQYGRYLLISSSRPGGQAANLQGLWNNLLTPPWGSKYTTNINLQMNYWPAEPLNLSALSEPFYTLTKDVAKTGKETARAHYGSPGWVLHHNTDIWRGTAPVNASNHGIWPTGGAWLTQQLWDHYQFGLDKDFLRNRAYPHLKNAAEFFVHTLVKDANTGYLISTPSNSPEHGGLVAGPTMDHQIIRDLYKNTIAAAKILGIDQKFADTLKQQYLQIAPNKVGRYGQLQEWLVDKDDTTDTHRHVSHMWAIYPGNEITPKTPALIKAAQQSMKYRGDEGTGWSIAWKVNIWARMKQGDHSWLMFTKLLSPADVISGKEKGGVYHNLFDAHPPFQIDGNFGGAAGVGEMLVQSQDGYIELLPALPSALPNGQIKGICARGGFELNLTWKAGKLVYVEALSKSGQPCTLTYKGKSVTLKTVAGKTYRFNGNLKKI